MMKSLPFVVGAVCALAGIAPIAPPLAQRGTRYDVKSVNSDLWCQEQAKLPVARCDQRLPEDEATFNAYRATIEKYETDYIKEKNSEQNFNRAIINRDELDKTTNLDRNPAPQTPQPLPKPAP